MSDEKRIVQILLNLLSNALKFTFQGFIMVSTQIIQLNDAPYLSFEVQDTGIGIHQEDISKLFQSFGLLESSASLNTTGTM